ncbi:hypothetical protein ASD53_18280 [Lysobacter sp. Root559]|nr:hypothetical protein ASD53_18280 [Lysobacter sp. Root559]
MQYDITNMDCLPPADNFQGVQMTPTSTFLPIILTKLSDTKYQGRVALDGLVDGNYFGQGDCHFKAIGPSVGFRATGAAGETRFFARLPADEMDAMHERTSYYWRGGYPRDKKVKDFPDHGSASPDDFQESLRDELFSITIAARKVKL